MRFHHKKYVAGACMEKLCDDIISSEILIRLPSKNLAQLRCVCKTWNTLLREDRLIKSHLRHSINDKDEILLLFNPGFPMEARSSASPDVKLNDFIKFPVKYPFDYKEAEEPVRIKYTWETVIGAANGLVCFSVGSRVNRVIHIWNPSLSALLTVPPHTIRGGNCTYFRFGFDAQNDDYKIVKLIRIDGVGLGSFQVEVYSMRSGCWKRITQRFPSRVSHFHRNYLPVCVDGYLHWHCSNRNSKIETIVAYDLAAESFNEISLPDPTRKYDHLGVFGGKLCVISFVRGGFDDCEVWVLDEYGSWVNSGFSHFHKGGIFPYGFTYKNNFIFEDRNEVIYLYDPAAPFNKLKPFQKSMQREDLRVPVILPYVESLVWVTPPGSKSNLMKSPSPLQVRTPSCYNRGRLRIPSFVSSFWNYISSVSCYVSK